MTRPDAAVSFADLAAAGVRLRPLEIVTIVRELAAQVAAGEAPGMPSAHVIRLSPSGAISIEGPVAASGRPVARAAQLLDSLLPGFDAAPEFRAPGALRLVVARALGTLDLPAYATLETFSEALARFSAPEAAPIVRQLVANWAECVAAEQSPNEQPDVRSVEIASKRPADDVRTESVLESFAVAAGSSHLSISDVRRARRATGLTLAQLSERSRIPVALLRELEWGYLPNWPVGHHGRTQLVRYARAAGLDEEVVVRAVWPLIEERTAAEPTVAEFADSPPHALAIDDDFDLAAITFEAPAVARIQPSRGTRILAALAIPALLAIAIAPAAWYQSTRRSRVEQVQPPVAATDVQTDSTASESQPPAQTQDRIRDAEARRSRGARPGPSGSRRAGDGAGRNVPDRLVGRRACCCCHLRRSALLTNVFSRRQRGLLQREARCRRGAARGRQRGRTPHHPDRGRHCQELPRPTIPGRGADRLRFGPRWRTCRLRRGRRWQTRPTCDGRRLRGHPQLVS